MHLVPKATPDLYAMIDVTGTVVGLVRWFGIGKFDAGSLRLVIADGAQIGWTYGAGIFKPRGERL
jgi:hypothetical protein